MDYGNTTVYRLSVEFGLLRPPLIWKEIGADMDIDPGERNRSTLDVDSVGVSVKHSLQIKGFKAVSPKLIQNDLGLSLITIPKSISISY